MSLLSLLKFVEPDRVLVDHLAKRFLASEKPDCLDGARPNHPAAQVDRVRWFADNNDHLRQRLEAIVVSLAENNIDRRCGYFFHVLLLQNRRDNAAERDRDDGEGDEGE